MGRRIMVADRRIEATTNDDAIANHQRAHRNLPKAFGSKRQRNRLAHEEFVVH
jgi:hypothetical protein